MSKKYTQVNNLVAQSRDNLHKAYDRGYVQGKEDYKRPSTKWIPEPGDFGLQFICEKCRKPAIASYLYCPNCGGKSTEEDGV